MTPCRHLPDDLTPPAVDVDGCHDCLAAGGRNWVHLRQCQACGHIGCCDQSPNRHATSHFKATDHPLIRSAEPGEDWWWCYADNAFFEVAGAPPAPTIT